MVSVCRIATICILLVGILNAACLASVTRTALQERVQKTLLADLEKYLPNQDTDTINRVTAEVQQIAQTVSVYPDDPVDDAAADWIEDSLNQEVTYRAAILVGTGQVSKSLLQDIVSSAHSQFASLSNARIKVLLIRRPGLVASTTAFRQSEQQYVVSELMQSHTLHLDISEDAAFRLDADTFGGTLASLGLLTEKFDMTITDSLDTHLTMLALVRWVRQQFRDQAARDGISYGTLLSKAYQASGPLEDNQHLKTFNEVEDEVKHEFAMCYHGNVSEATFSPFLLKDFLYRCDYLRFSGEVRNQLTPYVPDKNLHPLTVSVANIPNAWQYAIGSRQQQLKTR